MGKKKQRSQTTNVQAKDQPPRTYASDASRTLDQCTTVIAQLTRPVLVGKVLDVDTRKPIAGGQRTDQVTGAAVSKLAIDLVLEHLDAWAGMPDPQLHRDDGADDDAPTRVRGNADELAAISRVIRQSTNDAAELRRILTTVRKELGRAASIAVRAVETIHPDKLPKEAEHSTAIPACASCARTSGNGPKRIGGHFAPVRDDVAGHGLCDWCYRHALALAKERGLEQITPDCWPPIKACDLYHAQSPRAAGLHLAKEAERRARTATPGTDDQAAA